jgi:hypothetical protein
MEVVHRGEVVNQPDLAVEAHHCELDTPCHQTIRGQLLLESNEASVECPDGAATHGAGRVEEQEARATRLGVLGEFDRVT